ncbi:MAG: hypothetical protein EXS58_09060 [Candidatus Latescibacteria bacterium]|nr:hypothetical protein [Candidatus Latescibacterota bacterium]
MNDDAPDPQKKIRLYEDIFIVLCVLSLWPVILGWDEPAYEFALYLALAGLLVIFFRRMKRFQKAKREFD